MARFHGGHLDGQLFSEWPDPPASSVWAERTDEGAFLTEPPESGHPEAAHPGSPGFDRYVLAEVVADLAVYHFVEPS